MTTRLSSSKPQRHRLAAGGRIDRQKPLAFTFNGTRYRGYQGDTAASALLANGVSVVGRSLKYHRPRGIVGSGPEEPNAILQIGSGATTLPNQRATEVGLYEDLKAESVNCWPGVNRDIGAAIGLFARFLPPGFYYKTFMGPRWMWKRYEHFIRKAAGLGVSPKEPDPDSYDKMNAHCDVLVVGGGPAGLAAALEAGRLGARVILADEQAELGGSLLGSRELIDGAPAMEWAAAAVEKLASMDEVRLLSRSTVFGYYDHNFLTILERKTDHLAPSARTGPRERLWRVRAKQVVIAAGAIERPLVFPNNDRPGIMLASAASTYLNRYAVAPGSRALIFTNNDSAYRTALDLVDAGVSVTAVVDLRPEPGGPLSARVRQRGIEVIGGHAIVDVLGKKRVKSVVIMGLDATGDGVEGSARKIRCDLVAVSGGWSPTVHLHSQSGGEPRFDEDKTCFLPGPSVQAERSAGSCNGSFTLGECLAGGFAAGAGAAHAAGFGNGTTSSSAPTTADETEESLRPMWVVPSRSPTPREHKQFVDLQGDVTAADIVVAAREGFDSTPLLNRYTALGFGTDQGKLGN
ncbi:MAG: 2Fe-2S iron-sulfur cluster-binding protein, partial [Candidatus Neomarinimicrobiota bacterium]